MNHRHTKQAKRSCFDRKLSLTPASADTCFFVMLGSTPLFRCPNEACEQNKSGFRELLKTSSMSSTLECANCEVCLVWCPCCNKLVKNILADTLYCVYCNFQIPTVPSTRLFLGLPSLYPMCEDTIRCIQRSIGERQLIETAYADLQKCKNRIETDTSLNDRSYTCVRELAKLHQEYATLVNCELRQLDFLCLKSFKEPRLLVKLLDLTSHALWQELQDDAIFVGNIQKFFSEVDKILLWRSGIQKSIIFQKSITFIDDDENFVNHKMSKRFLQGIHKKMLVDYRNRLAKCENEYTSLLRKINELLSTRFAKVALDTSKTNINLHSANSAHFYSTRSEIDLLRKLYISVASVVIIPEEYKKSE